MASAPKSSANLLLCLAIWVLLLPVPTIIFTLFLPIFTASFIICFASDSLIAGLSPVVPKITTPSTCSICSLIKLSNDL